VIEAKTLISLAIDTAEHLFREQVAAVHQTDGQAKERPRLVEPHHEHHADGKQSR